MERFDFFGGLIYIRFKGLNTHKTKWGMIFTVTLIVVLIVRVSNLFNDFFDGRNPTVLYQERQVKNPKRFDITPEQFSMAFGLVDNNYGYHNETVFQIDSYIETKKTVFNEATQKNDVLWSRNSFIMEKCTPEHIINNTSLLNQFVNLDKHYCLPKNLPLYIEGEFNEDEYAAITILVKKCQGPNCQDDSYIQKALKLFWGEVIFSDVYVSPEQKNNPFTKYVRDIFWEVSDVFPKKVYMEMRNNYVESDYGLFSSEVHTDLYPSFRQYNEMVTNADEDVYSSFILRFEKKKENLYKRSYKTIVLMISELGGLFSVLTTLGVLLTYTLTQTHLNQELINNTFTFQEFNKEKESIRDQLFASSNTQSQAAVPQAIDFVQKQVSSTTPQKSVTVETQKQQNIIGKPIDNKRNLKRLNIPTNSNQLPQFSDEEVLKRNQDKETPGTPLKNVGNCNAGCVERSTVRGKEGQQTKCSENFAASSNQKTSSQIEALINKNTNSMKFNTFDYLISSFMKFGICKRKKAIYDYSIQQLYNHLDIQWIINKLIEFDKLKRILLDDDQLLLFEYLPKPSISYSFMNNSVIFHDNQKFTISKKSKNEIENLHRAIQSYKNTMNKQQLKINSIDNRLLKYIDSTYKDIFEEEYTTGSESKIENKHTLSFKQISELQAKKQDGSSVLEELQQEYLVQDDSRQSNLEDTIKQYSSAYKPSPANSFFSSSLQLQFQNRHSFNFNKNNNS